MEINRLGHSTTYKSGWWLEIGTARLINDFKTENDAFMRLRIAEEIALSDPLAILQEHRVAGFHNTFLPLAGLLTDPSIEVRCELAWGISKVLEAERGYGKYTKDFGKKLNPTPQNKIDCFTYVLKALEQLMESPFLRSGERILFYRSMCILNKLVDDYSISAIHRDSDFNQLMEYRNLLERLSQIDLQKLLKAVYIDQIQEDEQRTQEKFLTLPEAANLIIKQIIQARLNTHKRPLEYCFGDLQDSVAEIKKMMPKYRRLASEDLKNDLQRLVSYAIEKYLSSINSGQETITWEDLMTFNSLFENLLDFSLESNSNSCRNEILDLFETLNSEGVVLNRHSTLSLSKALNTANKIKFEETLRVLAQPRYITNIDEDELELVESSSQKKALAFYRNLPKIKSFKDYFGMTDLKKEAMSIASASLAGSAFSNGLLLSGVRGTGKSFFAETLVGELAIPLKVLTRKSIESEILSAENNEASILDQYLDKIENLGRCVLLVDEIDEIIKKQSNRFISEFLSFFSRLRKRGLPVILIATTNRPILNSVYGIKLDKHGRSVELNRELLKFVPSQFLRHFKPCYFFHKRSVGYNFLKEYLEYRMNKGDIADNYDLENVCNLARGLTPFKIKELISELKKPISLKQIASKLKEVKLQSGKVNKQKERIDMAIQMSLVDGKHSIIGKLNYKELAIVAEDIPPEVLNKIIKKVPPELTQKRLIDLFKKHLCD